jgi:hypothetical protein
VRGVSLAVKARRPARRLSEHLHHDLLRRLQNTVSRDVRAFAIFRRDRDENDAVDFDLADGHPLSDRFGLLPDHVRRVTSPDGLIAWVIPGTAGAMLRQRSPNRIGGYSTGGWSGPVQTVAQSGLFGWTESLDGVDTYYGLIPGGGQSALLSLADGHSIEIPVRDNVFIARLEARVVALEFRDGSGQLVVRQTGR